MQTFDIFPLQTQLRKNLGYSLDIEPLKFGHCMATLMLHVHVSIILFIRETQNIVSRSLCSSYSIASCLAIERIACILEKVNSVFLHLH